MTDYAAFISYSSRYREWVKVLHQNLEACLKRAGASKPEIFIDQVDLSVGRSWITQLQKGLNTSDRLILVITPEALASPRVEDEWQGFVDRHKIWDRAGMVLPIVLRKTPLPSFLSKVEWIDFTEPNAYQNNIAELTAGILGWEGTRHLPALPKSLVTPPPIPKSLPDALREQLLNILAPLLKKNVYRGFLLGKLKLEPDTLLEGHPAPELAASALLVHARGNDDELTATRRIVTTLMAVLSDEEPETVRSLETLSSQLDQLLDRNDREPSLLERYREQVVRDHEHLVPVFQRRTELDLLDRVYVRLELSADLKRADLKRESLERSDLSQRLGTQVGIRDLIALDPETDSWVTRRWVVRGDPGAGKTTLLRHLAATLARDSESAWVPVFESLPRLLRDREPLLERLERKMEAIVPADGLVGVLEHEAQQGHLLLLLDGLDEAPQAVGLLREVSMRWPKATIVVTSRPIGYQRPDNVFVEVDILPLDIDRQKRFLARWFGRHTDTDNDDAAADALEILQAESSLKELASNPLYLTLMALLIERDEALSRRRDRLYDQVFQLLLEGGHRSNDEDGGEPLPSQDKALEALRFLAYGMTEDNLDAEPVIKLEERLYRPEADCFRKTLERVPDWRRSMRPFLNDLAKQTGILGPHDGPDSDWRYWHRTFREALASEELAERFKTSGGEAVILEHARSIEGDESRWAEPYALLTGRLEKPDDLVRALVKENKALGLRALATAQTLKDETLTEVLELSDQWKERIEVYKQLPELIDDPERLLPLLDRLRQRTRNGNDLFHLDLAFEEVIKKWPDAASRAEALRSQLFDHIPKPSEDLFRWIETPKDGRVELWQTIPAGSFLMGDSGEIQVEIKAPFAMAAVPATNAQFTAFDSDREPHGWNGVSADDLAFHPVVAITWFEASIFCKWLSQSFEWAKGARLPSEEEWEYACRVGTTTRYWSGDTEDDLERVGWYRKNSEGRTHRVGEKEANPWGLYDVHGNVDEWTCSEQDEEVYSRRPADFPVDPRSNPAAASAAAPSAERVFRGGSYWDTAGGARSAYRGWVGPGGWDGLLGFRVLLPFPPKRPLIIDH